jgi:hypothetical protein
VPARASPIPAISITESIEAVEEVYVPNNLACPPWIILKMLVPVIKMPRDREFHIVGTAIVGIVNNCPGHGAKNSLNDVQELRGRRQRQ